MLWHQGTAAAAACRVTLETQEGKRPAFLFLSAEHGLGRALQIPCGAGAAWKPVSLFFKSCN